MPIDQKIRAIRTLVRNNSKTIIDHIITKHLKRINGTGVINQSPDICMFCGACQNLTKEHVIPKWVYENSTTKDFITGVNGLRQTYNRTSIPACLVCNSDLLNALEKNIQQLFSNIDLENDFFSIPEIENIIRWLEIIEYKFQILDITRRFKASKEKGYIPYLADFPISMLRLNKDYTPSKVLSEIRKSQKRIIVKEKNKHINSLVVFETSNTSYHFIHKMDDFIFIELPKYKIALFYFYNKEFKNVNKAYKETKKILDKVYN